MDDLRGKLKGAGHKITAPRLAVWKCLGKNKKLLSAREIHKKIGNFDQASVYRVLKLFESIGFVKTEIINKEKFYCAQDKPHHHIICRECGYAEDFPCTHKFNKYKNFTAIEHQLTLYGVCGRCAK
jgi:Fe2+ or Zn2+ uptake regulation protein